MFTNRFAFQTGLVKSYPMDLLYDIFASATYRHNIFHICSSIREILSSIFSKYSGRNELASFACKRTGRRHATLPIFLQASTSYLYLLERKVRSIRTNQKHRDYSISFQNDRFKLFYKKRHRISHLPDRSIQLVVPFMTAIYSIGIMTTFPILVWCCYMPFNMDSEVRAIGFLTLMD